MMRMINNNNSFLVILTKKVYTDLVLHSFEQTMAVDPLVVGDDSRNSLFFGFILYFFSKQRLRQNKIDTCTLEISRTSITNNYTTVNTCSK